GHPGAGHAVLEGVGPARVGGDVPTDLRLLGRAGVGRVEKAALPGPAAQGSRRHPGLDGDPPDERVERADADEPLEAEDEAAVEWNRPPGQAAASTPGDDRDVVVVAPAD